MMISMAQAKHTERDRMVYVMHVYGGQYLVEDQWTGERWEIKDLSELTGLWINTDLIDTFDEFVRHFGIEDSYHIVASIVYNRAWAQAIAQQWAGLY